MSSRKFSTKQITAMVVAVCAAVVALPAGVFAASSAGLVLGQRNTEKHSTQLTNSGSGAALELATKSGKAPALSVGSNKTLIPNLNANFINGLTSAQLQRRVVGDCGADAAVGSIGRTGSVACHATGLVGYATPGAHTYVAPAGVTEVIVEMWGGGGGGGSSTSPSCDEVSGGGQGAYLRVVVPVTPGHSYTAVVGSAGPGGDTDCGQGTAGGDSTFASSDVAGGGNGGGSGGPSTVAGGLGGSPTVGLARVFHANADGGSVAAV